jgi:hypothetical protein
MMRGHAIFYQKHWGFGLFFETKVATEMSEFLSRFDEARDGSGLSVSTIGLRGALRLMG